MLMALLRAMIMSALRSMTWTAGTALELLLLPLRLFGPPSGHPAIPPAPARQAPRGPAPIRRPPTPTVPQPSVAHQQAAAVIDWLHRRLRQGSGAGELSPAFPHAVRSWARSLDDDQSRHAISLGIVRLSEHLAGRRPEPALPPRDGSSRPCAFVAPTHGKPAPRKARERFEESEFDYSMLSPR